MPAPDQNSVSSKDSDAKVRFVMNKSGMKVGISRYSPPTGKGLPLSPSLILKQLREAGVTAELDPLAAKKACEILTAGGDVGKLIIAQGRPAVEPRDASVDLKGDPNCPVLPGMLIGKMLPAAQAVNGLTADGKVLSPHSQSIPKNLKASDNIQLDQGNLSLKSSVYGLVRVTEEEVFVEPLIQVAPDHFQVTATLYPADFLGQALTTNMLDEELKRLSVVLKLNSTAVQHALAKAAETKKPQDVVLVQGTAPSPGNDGWLELLVKVRESGPVEVEGKIDYSERGAFPSVEAEMTVAVLHPPSRGVPGLDVYGRPHPAREGKPAEVFAGENVELLPDGISYKAIAPGMVVYERNTLMVTDCLEVKRDVGYATGNIRVEKGSVKIRGAVTKGFAVCAPGHIVVEDVIESANVETCGDVHVRGGILMPGGGVVKAGGNVVAQYAINARIVAGGDVIIANEVSNSTIQAGGKFIATKGTGIVQGCEIVSGTGIHVNELGSSFGALTVVAISAKDTQHTELLKEKSKLRRRIRRVNEILGVSDPKTILTRTPAAKRQAVAEVLKARIRDQTRLQEISDILAAEQEERLRALEAARITVSGAVYPGVVVKFGGRVLKVTDALSNAKFTFGRKGRGVTVTSG